MTDQRAAAWPALLGLCAAAAVARVAGLSGYYLSPDEATIMAIAREPTLARVFSAALVQAHPPFHFFLMHFWPDPQNSIMWLRLSSLLPGLLLIPAAYRLGKKAAGPAAAWLMAFIAAFGHGPFVLSQVVRPYAALGLLLLIASWCYLDFAETGRGRAAAGYMAATLFALCLHYSATLFIAASGLAGSAWILARHRPPRQMALWAAAHLPAITAAAALYHFHLGRISGLRRDWMEGYLALGFPDSAGRLASNFFSVFYYLFHPQFAPVFVLLALAGMGGLAMKRRWTTFLLCVSSLAVALAFNLTGKYPLYGMRHAFWLFPALALPVSAAPSLLNKYRFAQRLPAAFRGPRLKLLLIWGLAALVAAGYIRIGCFRKMTPTREAEFPIRREIVAGIQQWLATRTTSDDLILTSMETADLLRFSPAAGQDRLLKPNLHDLLFAGRHLLYPLAPWIYSDRRELRDSLRLALDARPSRPDSSLILLNLGYGSGSMEGAADSLLRGSISSAERTGTDYLLILRLSAEQVAAALSEPGPSPAN